MLFQPQRHPAVSVPAGECSQEAEGPVDPTKPGDFSAQDDFGHDVMRWSLHQLEFLMTQPLATTERKY